MATHKSQSKGEQALKRVGGRSRFARFVQDAFSETEADRASEEVLDPPQPFIVHFIALRNCIVRCFLSWVLAMAVVAPFAPQVIEWLKGPLVKSGLMAEGVQVVGFEMGIGFGMFMTTMVWGGTILALPFLIYFVFGFVFPGLKRHERNLVSATLLTGLVLFFMGAWLCYGFTLTLAMDALMAINQWMGVPVTMLLVEGYIGLVLKMLLAFGLAFQFPLVLLVLGWLGIISSAGLRKHRGVVIIVIFTVAMFLTPPDPLSQIIMAVPMCLLYELTIGLIRLRERLAAAA